MEMPKQFELYSQRFAQHAPYPVFFVNEKQRVSWLNEAGAIRETSGGVESLNCEIADVLFDWGVQADEVGEALLCLEGGYPQRIECSEIRWYCIDIDVLYDDGKAGGFIVSLLPRRLDHGEGDHCDGAKRLFGLIGVGVRNRLHSVSGFGELLANTSGEPEMLGSMVSENSRELLKLWSDAEELLLLDSQSVSPVKKRFSVEECLREIVEEVDLDLDRVGNSVQFEYSKDLPAALIGNLDDLKRLVKRLVCRVATDSKEGIVNFRVSWARPSRLDRAALRLEVQSDVHDSKDWIEAFYSPDAVDRYGICKAIILKLVERIGGRFFYKGGEDLCVKIMMDLAMDPSFEEGALGEIGKKEVQGRNQDEADRMLAGRDLAGVRALVADEDDGAREVTCALLKQIGVTEVYSVATGVEVAEVLNEYSLDVAFVSLGLPEVGKREFWRDLDAVKTDDLGALRLIGIQTSVDVLEEHSVFERVLVKPFNSYDLKVICLALEAETLKIEDGEESSFDLVEIENDEGMEKVPVISFDEWKNDPVLHKRMLSMLLEDAPKTLSRIEEETKAADYGQLERVVHYFKGSVDVVRADRLTQVSQRALDCLQDGEYKTALAAIAELPEAYLEFTSYLQEVGYMDES